MKWYTPLLVVLALVWPGSAVADPPQGHTPQDPCAHNPTTLCDDDIVVVVEPPGDNCEFGGFKVTIGDNVSFICNGAPGVPGAEGPAGPPGATGTPGVPGALPSCVPNRQVSLLRLPKRFPTSGVVRVRMNGQTQTRRIRRKRNVLVRLPRECGVFPISVRMRGRGPRPALRIWIIRPDGSLQKFTVGNKGTGRTR